MGKHWYLSLALIIAALSLAACEDLETQATSTITSPIDAPTIAITEASDVPTVTPVPKTVLKVLEEARCNYGPGVSFDTISLLGVDQYYEILGIDDDVTWVQIDPNALVDPNPPHTPLNELSPQPDPPGSQMSLRCWVPGGSVEIIGDLASVPVVQIPSLGLIGETSCYSGPGDLYSQISLLSGDQFFDILGIDDDVTWMRNSGTQIDDDVTWFQIDPNAIIDPMPPGITMSNTNGVCPALYQMKTRCWVPGSSVTTSGDLTTVPLIRAPTLKMEEQATCFDGPGENRNPVSVLNIDQLFEIVGIDDDVTWIDDDVTWFGNPDNQIDDDVTWLQINPNAIIDPTPPGSQLSPRCWVKGSSGVVNGNLFSIPVILKPHMVVMEGTYCFVGPAWNYKALTSLDLNQIFRILGIDGRLATTVGDINWFQINPAALVDPNPPHRPLAEVDQAMTTFCWVPGSQVKTCGELSLLPVVPAPALILPTVTLTSTPASQPPRKLTCGDFNTQNECNAHANDMQCYWEPNKNICVKQ